MLGVGGRSAIAAGHDLAIGRKGSHGDFDRLGDRAGHALDAGQLELGAVFEMA
jgi:hypothetical protein